MSTKISFLRPVDAVEREMGRSTADEEMVFLEARMPPPAPPPAPPLAASTATDSLWTYIFSASVEVDCGYP